MRGETALGLAAAFVGGVWLFKRRGGETSSGLSLTEGTDQVSGSNLAGRQFVSSLPNGFSMSRDKALYDAISANQYRSLTWSTVTSRANGHTLELQVTDDALCVGSDSDWVRFNVTHRTAQLMADEWQNDQGQPAVCLLTSLISDLAAQAAQVRISATILSGTPEGLAKMSTTEYMLKANDQVNQKIAGRSGLCMNVGKDWVCSPRLGTPSNPALARDSNGNPRPGIIAAANYGLYKDPSNPAEVWQHVGIAHGYIEHTDYSQVVRFVSRTALLDGQTYVDLYDVGADPSLCDLVSSEGPVLMRHPAVPIGSTF